MMDYKEMSAIIKERVREINYKKKVRARRIKQISCAISGLCAVAIVGFGIWHNKDLKNAVHHESNKNIIEESATTLSTINNELTTTSAELAKTTKAITTSVTSAAYKTKSTTETENKVVTMANTKPVATFVSTQINITAAISQTNTATITSATTSATYEMNTEYRFITYKSRIILENETEINENNIPEKVTFNGKEASFCSAKDFEDSKKIEMMQDFYKDYKTYTYSENYDLCSDENVIYTEHMIEYTYSNENNTVYSIGMSVYKLWLGTDKTGFVIKFDNSDNYYLYSTERENPYEEIKNMSQGDPRFYAIPNYSDNTLNEIMHDIYIGVQKYTLNKISDMIPNHKCYEHTDIFIKTYYPKQDRFYYDIMLMYKYDNNDGTFSYFANINDKYYMYTPVINDEEEYIPYVKPTEPTFTSNVTNIYAPDEDTVYNLFDTLLINGEYQLVRKANVDETNEMNELHDYFRSYNRDTDTFYVTYGSIFNWNSSSPNDVIIKFDDSDEYYYYSPISR